MISILFSSLSKLFQFFSLENYAQMVQNSVSFTICVQSYLIKIQSDLIYIQSTLNLYIFSLILLTFSQLIYIQCDLICIQSDLFYIQSTYMFSVIQSLVKCIQLTLIFCKHFQCAVRYIENLIKICSSLKKMNACHIE